MEEEEKRQAEADRKRQAREELGAAAAGDPDAKFGKWFSNPSDLKGVQGGVGKYLSAAVLPPPPAPASDVAANAAAMPPPPAKKAKTSAPGFGNFDGW